MDVSRTRALRGPNMWSRHTAIEAVVHCNDAERSLERLPGFIELRFQLVEQSHELVSFFIAEGGQKLLLIIQRQRGHLGIDRLAIRCQ